MAENRPNKITKANTPSSASESFRVNLLLVGFFVFLFTLDFFHPFLAPFERKILDTRFQIRGVEKPDSKVAIITIDEKSMKALGAWPWPRSYFAQLNAHLSEAGAAVVAYDIIFSEAEHNLGLQTFQDLVKQYRDLELDSVNTNARLFFQTLMDLEDGLDNDQLFANSLEQAGNVVLPLVMNFGAPEDPATRQENLKTLESIGLPDFRDFLSNKEDLNVFSIYKGTRLVLPIPELAAGAMTLAHVNAFPDADGGLRWENLLIQYEDRWFPSFALMLAALYQQVESIAVVLGEGIHLDEQIVPMNESGRMLIDYRGPPGTFPYYSFNDIVEGKVPSEAFAGKVVLIGSTVTGLHDSYPTPYSGFLPGVEMHANVIQNILDQRFLIRSTLSQLTGLAGLILFGVLFSWVLPRLSVYGMLALTSSGVLGYFFGVQYVFEHQRFWLNSVLPMTEIAGLLVTTLLIRFNRERREKKFIKGAFGQYLSPAIIDRLIKSPDLLKLGGEEKLLTAFFSDVAGFSTISEKLTPSQLVHLLNFYLTEMTEIILDMQGTVDKYEGDAIIAFFGAPLPDPEHARRCCIAAIRMQKKLEELRAQWKRSGEPELFMRIGINTGRMVVGNMGSETRMDYTIMGDSVNLAARLEGANKEYGTHTMISEFTLEHVGDAVEVRELDCIRVVGKLQPVKVYELLAEKGQLDNTQSQLVPLYNKGLEAYRDRRWQEATEFFEQALTLDPEDGPSRVYVERCKEFQAHPPSPDWDGVFSLTSK